MSPITQIPATDWIAAVSPELQRAAVAALEDGHVVLLPELRFKLSDGESRFLTPDLVGGSKNVSYNIATGKIGHCLCADADKPVVTAMMDRFAKRARGMVERLFPAYLPKLTMGRTSLRPVEAAGRAASWRKDDTRLHVDSFPTTPVNGKRILRVFSNVNPAGRPRCWRVGEPFEQVSSRFLPSIPPPPFGARTLMQVFRVTRGRRSLYDHYMLRLHDAMKADDTYQKTCPQTNVDLPSGSTWMVFTDSVPHAVTSGQHQFEQTFYLEADGMTQPEKSPLRILEKQLARNLRN